MIINPVKPVKIVEDNFIQNLERVKSLVAFYTNHPDTKVPSGEKEEPLDILRAAVVFLHASLEDLLRSIAYYQLPYASSDVLDEIPLAGFSNAKKFTLGELAKHRDENVKWLIQESIYEYLKRSNFNNLGEIIKLIKSMKIDTLKVNKRFKDLAGLMERRHQIVHRADRLTEEDEEWEPDNTKIRVITKESVLGWISAVEDFGISIIEEWRA